MVVLNALFCRMESDGHSEQQQYGGHHCNPISAPLRLLELLRHQRWHQQLWYVHRSQFAVQMQYLACVFLYVFHTQLHQRCVGPPQALCLRTAEYLTASATTSSSTRFTNEICEARPGNRVEVIIHSDKHEKLSVLHKMKVLRVE